ncbi:hypothetical protein EGK_13579 [Macaca mulatta]|uniref:Uncharacterized protein n=3 Tax=Cercopithecinae TaxID=9528 RepID=G7P163_MACFA|nr:hypothetical protein EGK_13579 [Macaca mulatta]EHH52073.1 hypothetical protein EGM_12442 [Macaca fascicularis]
MRATAVAVTGPAAGHAAPRGPPVPATTAGAALRAGASEPRQTQLGAPLALGEARGGPQDPGGEGAVPPCPQGYKEVSGPVHGQMGPGKTLRVGTRWTRRSQMCCFYGCPLPPRVHLLCPGNKEPLRTQGSPHPPSC